MLMERFQLVLMMSERERGNLMVVMVARQRIFSFVSIAVKHLLQNEAYSLAFPSFTSV